MGGYIASVVSASDYEPFGLVLDGRSLRSGGYRWGFNGKEDDGDFGEGLVDFGARVYNSVIGRFASVDRLSGKFPYMSPFIIASNSPIMAIDVNGDSTLFLNSKGEVLYWQYDGLKNAVVIIDDKQIKAFVKDFKKKYCCRIKSPCSETSLFNDTEMEGLRSYGTAYDYEAISEFFDFSVKRQKRAKTEHYFLDDKGKKAASLYNEAAIAMVVKDGILTTDNYSSKDMSRILLGGHLAVFNISDLKNKPGAKSYLHIHPNIYLYSFMIHEKCNSCDYHYGITKYHRDEAFNVPGPVGFP